MLGTGGVSSTNVMGTCGLDGRTEETQAVTGDVTASVTKASVVETQAQEAFQLPQASQRVKN